MSDRNAVEARIIGLRDRYLDFAQDGTRVSSMRRMAAEVADDLTVLLREMGEHAKTLRGHA